MLEVVKAVADIIQEVGSIPSGHLYVRMQGHMSLRTYEALIGSLINAGLVKQDGSFLLTWIGPKKETK
jgi:hypothetical protein